MGYHAIHTESGTADPAEAAVPLQQLRLEDGESTYIESDDEDDTYRLTEAQSPNRPKKISEKKRQDAATFQSWMEKNQRELKDSPVVDDLADDTRMSVGRLVKRDNADRKIIASPREYQIDLFERAKQKNTIVVLDTGSGKTLIAALLIRHTIEKELEDRFEGNTKRVSFFLVEKVALCFQQFAVLQCNLDYPIAKFFGDMTGIMKTKKFWDHQLETNMVLVCTAQILLDCLSDGFISMEQINLLVFDEAHHTKKNHPYARIMKRHYMQTKGQRPRILGMTASPVDAQTRDVKAVAAELEGMLCSEIATVSDKVLEDCQARKQQIEIKESYARLEPPEHSKTALWGQISSKVSYNPQFRSSLEFTKEASSSLGKWCADRYWQLTLTDGEVARLSARTDRDFGDDFGTRQSDEATDAIKAVKKVVENHTFSPVKVMIPDLSTKVLTLRRVLEEAFTEEERAKRCIVFVEKRHTACLLADLFGQQIMQIPGMNVGYMIGCQPATVTFGNMSFRNQIMILQRFRRGEINCLFATPIAEEGIDIPECDLIVRFDLYNSVIQYLQSKGRARQDKSKYINMAEEGNLRHLRLMYQAARDSIALRRFCSALPEDRKVQEYSIDALAMAQHEMAGQKTYEVQKTGARLTFSHSLEVLAKFVSSLNLYGVELRPEYVTITTGKKFVADVILPNASPIKCVSGFPQRNKILARCSAAFEACVSLIQKGYIDNHFQPTFTKRLHAMRNARLAVSSSKKDTYNMRIKPDIWKAFGDEMPKELFATLITLDNPKSMGREARQLLLLSRKGLPDLPDIPLFFENNQSSQVKLRALDEPLSVNQDEIDRLAAFTLRVFEDVFSKLYDVKPEELPYFLGPCVQGQFDMDKNVRSMLDWPLIELTREKECLDWEGQEEAFFQGKFIVDPWDGSRKMITHGINKSLKPSDPTPEDAPQPTCRAYRFVERNIKEYSTSLWLKARQRVRWKDDQPVVKAELLSLRRNLLDELHVDEKENKECHIILEPLRISTLPVDVVTMAMAFPAIIHRIDSNLIALEACSLLSLTIDPRLALEALTKDSDNSGDHMDEQINFQPGMGSNYERLEFLGDTFLKMATTIAVFTHFPTKDECEYHVERMLLICNQNLFNHAVDRGIQEYVRSKSFNRRTWYPDLQLKRGKAPKTAMNHNLSNKTIADVCEALIGAAYLSGGADDDFDMAVKAVTKMVKGKNHKMQNFSDYYAAFTIPEWQVAPSSASQRLVVEQVAESVGYEFKSPTLLRSAFKHPSYPYDPMPHYQRLEFLGDALLDMSIVDYLFKRFPAADPQWLTEHKMAMVSNRFLGCICVKLGLHQHLLLTASHILTQIREYVSELNEAEEAERQEAADEGRPMRLDFWLNACNPPKALPDIVEALVGAMFVDSQYNYAPVRSFFTRFIQPYFQDMALYDTFATKHPVTSLWRKLQREMFCAEWRICTSDVPCDEKDGVEAITQSDIVCALVIHGQVVAYTKGKSGRYTKAAMARDAVKMIEKMGKDAFREKVGCDCQASAETVLDGKLEDHGTAI